MNVQEAIDYAHKYGAKMVDLKFTDLLGTWQHLTIPIAQLKKDIFKDRAGF